MQREFKKKTVTYGVIAVLLAVLLTAVCYNFGGQFTTQSFFLERKTFSSYEEIKNFLKTNMELMENVQGRLTFFRGGWEEAQTLSPDVKAAPAHSTTNIQVEGVDEADIVKTDDEGCLYVVSGNEIYILQAYPPEKARVLSKIVLNETYGIEIYVKGNRLAVLGNNYMPAVLEYMPYAYAEAFINVYDISNRSEPTLTRTVSLNGTISGSRMIGDYVYAVITQPAIRPTVDGKDFEVNLPRIVVNGNSVKEVQPNEISYVNVSDASYSFTTIMAVNIINDSQEPICETVLTSVTSCMYVSTNNMYLTVPNTNLWILSAET
ncbi:MAG: beta-propeller domain-containing protein, partial [Candidatus Bathyarchaeia archaeon]